MWTRWPTNAWSTQAENVGLEEWFERRTIRADGPTNWWVDENKCMEILFLFFIFHLLFETCLYFSRTMSIFFQWSNELNILGQKNRSPQLFNQIDQQSQAFHPVCIMLSCLFDASVLQTCPPACCACVWRVQCIVRRSAQTWPLSPPCLKRRPICMPASTRSRRSALKILLAFVSLVSFTTCWLPQLSLSSQLSKAESWLLCYLAWEISWLKTK